MNLNKELFKAALAVALTKQGSSLQEFEAALASQNQQKIASFAPLIKEAANPFGAIVDFLTNALPATAILGGVGAGSLGYSAWNKMHDTDRSMDEGLERRKKLQEANQQLASLLQQGKTE